MAKANVVAEEASASVPGAQGVEAAVSHAGRGRRRRRAMERRGWPQRLLEAQHSLLRAYLAEGEGGRGLDRAMDRSGGAAHSEIVSGWCASTAVNVTAGRWERGTVRDASAASSAHLGELIRGRRALRVEIGAGSGDWLVAQASAEPDVGWVAVEPQLDRVHSLWCKVQLRCMANVHICATGAAAALGGPDALLPSECADEIHVRFPYPPPLELRALTCRSPPGGVFGGGSFLLDAMRTLRVGGRLRLITNEASWCAFMLAQVARLHQTTSDSARTLRPLPGFEAGFRHAAAAPATDDGMDDSDHGDASASFFDVVRPGERWELAYEVVGN